MTRLSLHAQVQCWRHGATWSCRVSTDCSRVEQQMRRAMTRRVHNRNHVDAHLRHLAAHLAADAASHRLCSAAATRPAASLVIATAKASTILPTLAYAADATVASHLRACTLASVRARVLALASPRAHSACAGVAACTERRAQEAVLVQRGIRQAGWRRIHRIHPRARSHASGGGMRQRCTAARHFRPQLETAL